MSERYLGPWTDEPLWLYADVVSRSQQSPKGHLVRRPPREVGNTNSFTAWCGISLIEDLVKPAPYASRCGRCVRALNKYVARSLAAPPQRVVETVTITVERDCDDVEAVGVLVNKAVARKGWKVVAQESEHEPVLDGISIE